MTTTSTMTTTTCWDDIRSEWSKAQQMGHQAVMQAAKIGRMLIDMKGDTPIRDFVQRAEQEVQGLKQTSIQNLMNIAQHHALIEAEKPSSQRQALALIKKAKRPPTPQRNPVAVKQLRLEGRQSRARDAARLAEVGAGTPRCGPPLCLLEQGFIQRFGLAGDALPAEYFSGPGHARLGH